MNQMLIPAQLGAPQSSGQSGDTETLSAPESGEGALFGLMMGFVQQPELAAEWRQELVALGNSLPPEQAKALNSWLQQLSSGQLKGAELDRLPAGMGQMIEERLPQLASLLNQAVASGGESFKQALAQLRSGGKAGVELEPGASARAVTKPETSAMGAQEGKGLLPETGLLRPQPADPSRLWSLNPVAKMIQAGVTADPSGLEGELAEGLESLDSARPLRGQVAAAQVEPRGADPLTRTVATPIHEQSWGRNFAEQVMLVQQAGSSRARLILDPPNLGPVEVEMKMKGEQTNIVFHSPHQAVRDSIENNLPRLREMLAEQGVDLLDVNVSGEQPRDEQPGAREQLVAEGQGPGEEADGRPGEDDAATQTTMTVSDLSLVDYYA